MKDHERIARILQQIEGYMHDIEVLGISTPGDLADRKNFYALSMVLFSLLDSVIDLAEEIVIADDLGMPSTYREIFSLLAGEGIIDQQLFGTMSSLVSYRNRLAHEYGEITPDDLVRVLSMNGEVRTFVAIVRNRVATSQES